MGRHVTYLRVKAVESDEGRFIEGWASTPTVDRLGDIVSPEGARYRLPIPMLFAHDHAQPIGSVVRATVSRAGIRIRAKLTAGVAKADEVWRLIVDGALTAVSIGFQSLRSTPLPDGGTRFDEWSWHELSVVSVPANPDARIVVGRSVAYSTPPRITIPAPTPAPSIPPAWRVATNERRWPGETELQRHYRQFDACAEMLPRDLQIHADVTLSSCENGVMRILDAAGATLAHVDLRTRTLRLIDADVPEPKPEPKPAPKPAPRISSKEFVTYSALKKILKATREAEGKRLTEYLRPFAQTIIELDERIASLEKQLRDADAAAKAYWSRSGKKT